MRNRRARLQRGAEPVPDGAHQQGQAIDFSHHVNVDGVLLANSVQPAAQAMSLAWHNQRDGGKLVRRDAIAGQRRQHVMGANQEQTFLKNGSGAPAQDLLFLENDG